MGRGNGLLVELDNEVEELEYVEVADRTGDVEDLFDAYVLAHLSWVSSSVTLFLKATMGSAGRLKSTH